MKGDSFRADFRRNILTGLAGLLPLILTIFLLTLAVRFADRYVAEPVNRQLKSFLVNTAPGQKILRSVFRWDASVFTDKEKLQKKLDERFPGVLGFSAAVVVALVFVYLFGYVLTSLVGQRIYRKAEKTLNRFPIIKSIYPPMKRLTGFLFGGEHRRFNRVVAIRYPHPDTYALAFVTADGVGELEEKLNRRLLTVFLPTSPTPFTGFVLQVPAEEAIPLAISVDEAFSYTVSGGVLTPRRQQTMAGSEAAPAALNGEQAPPDDE